MFRGLVTNLILCHVNHVRLWWLCRAVSGQYGRLSAIFVNVRMLSCSVALFRLLSSLVSASDEAKWHIRERRSRHGVDDRAAGRPDAVASVASGSERRGRRGTSGGARPTSRLGGNGRCPRCGVSLWVGTGRQIHGSITHQGRSSVLFMALFYLLCIYTVRGKNWETATVHMPYSHSGNLWNTQRSTIGPTGEGQAVKQLCLTISSNGRTIIDRTVQVAVTVRGQDLDSYTSSHTCILSMNMMFNVVLAKWRWRSGKG